MEIKNQDLRLKGDNYTAFYRNLGKILHTLATRSETFRRGADYDNILYNGHKIGQIKCRLDRLALHYKYIPRLTAYANLNLLELEDINKKEYINTYRSVLLAYACAGTKEIKESDKNV